MGLFPQAGSYQGRLVGPGVRVGLHFHLDFVNLHPRLTKNVGQTRHQLPDLGRHCAAPGVDNDSPQFHIGHAAMPCQCRRDGTFEDVLKFQQLLCVGR